MGDTRQHRFGEGPAFTVGVEEELLLVDRASGELSPVCRAATEGFEAAPGRVSVEIHPALVELITPICRDAGEAVGVLASLRARLAERVGLLGAGVHPTAPVAEPPEGDSPRYARICSTLGDLLATPVAGLHVHVGMPDPETAIAAFNGIRRHLPLLTALSANSPFRHGRDSGLDTARAAIMASWPRSGIPRAFSGFDDFLETADALAETAGARDYTEFWWEVRPHPLLGTVEVRTMDTQASLDALAGLVALVHGLAVHEAHAGGGDGPPPEVLSEASFQAARFGLDARLPGAGGELRPARKLALEAVALARDPAREVGSAEALDEVERIVREGNGAARQRAAGVERAVAATRRETERPARTRRRGTGGAGGAGGAGERGHVAGVPVPAVLRPE